MGDVIVLKQAFESTKVNKHVFYSSEDVTLNHYCEVCGNLPVVDGVVIHTLPIEEHPDYGK